MSYLKICPDCGTKFWTTNGYRYCVGCCKQRRKSIRRSGQLTPLPRYRRPAWPDERGTIQ